MDVRVWAAIHRAYIEKLSVYDAFQANIAHAAISPHLKDPMNAERFKLLK